jgi:hypothetical protein
MSALAKTAPSFFSPPTLAYIGIPLVDRLFNSKVLASFEFLFSLSAATFMIWFALPELINALSIGITYVPTKYSYSPHPIVDPVHAPGGFILALTLWLLFFISGLGVLVYAFKKLFGIISKPHPKENKTETPN